MSWNNRVCKETHQRPTGDILTYSIREVYYANKEQTEIYGITQDPIGVCADIWADDITEEECLKDMKETIERFAKALEQPIIDLDTVEYTEREEEDV